MKERSGSTKKHWGPTTLRWPEILNNMAMLLGREGNYAAARPLGERALRINEKALGPDHPEVAINSNNLAYLLSQQGDQEGARRLYERALTINEKTLGPDHPYVGQNLDSLAGLLSKQGLYKDAIPLVERAIGIFEKRQREEPGDMATGVSLGRCFLTLGSVEQGLGDGPKALEAYGRSAETLRPLAGGSASLGVL